MICSQRCKNEKWFRPMIHVDNMLQAVTHTVIADLRAVVTGMNCPLTMRDASLVSDVVQLENRRLESATLAVQLHVPG